MKDLRIKVRKFQFTSRYDFGIFVGHKILMVNDTKIWATLGVAIRNAKAMAKRIGIKYDSEIVKQYKC